jgi:hypothetical protein
LQTHISTVDLISYTITALAPTPELDESAPGIGGLCGSSFLDREFDKWLRDKFVGFHRWDDLYHSDAMRWWESETKRNFTGDIKKKYHIPARGLPDTPELGIRGGKFEIPGKKVEELFEPVVLQILGLVRSQIDETKRSKAVKAVLLAGGFGRNEYLKQRIQTAVGDGVKVERMRDWYALGFRRTMEVHADEASSNTAIVRGALIRGLADKQLTVGRPTISVKSRVARKHYGTVALERYDPEKHDSTRKRYVCYFNVTTFTSFKKQKD